jgi:hypothetical protein
VTFSTKFLRKFRLFGFLAIFIIVSVKSLLSEKLMSIDAKMPNSLSLNLY